MGLIGVNTLSNFGLDGAGGGLIKSTQNGVADFSNTDTDITISPVDTDQSIVIINFVTKSTSSNRADRYFVRANLTTSTNLNLLRYNSDSSLTISVFWEVIEFESSVTVQQGEFTGSAATIDVTISPVEIQKALLFYSFRVNATTATVDGLLGHMKIGTFNAVDTLRFENFGSLANQDYYWYVIQLP